MMRSMTTELNDWLIASVNFHIQGCRADLFQCRAASRVGELRDTLAANTKHASRPSPSAANPALIGRRQCKAGCLSLKASQ